MARIPSKNSLISPIVLNNDDLRVSTKRWVANPGGTPMAARPEQGAHSRGRVAEGHRPESGTAPVVRSRPGQVGGVPEALLRRARSEPGCGHRPPAEDPGGARHVRLRRAGRAAQRRPRPQGVPAAPSLLKSGDISRSHSPPRLLNAAEGTSTGMSSHDNGPGRHRIAAGAKGIGPSGAA